MMSEGGDIGRPSSDCQEEEGKSGKQPCQRCSIQPLDDSKAKLSLETRSRPEDACTDGEVQTAQCDAEKPVLFPSEQVEPRSELEDTCVTAPATTR